MANYLSSPARVFNIPELVVHVSTFCRHSDLIRLARVSRRTFGILIPVIWRSVKGVPRLLRLIKTVSFRYETPETPYGCRRLKEIIIGEQSEIDGCDLFERFNIYAPHVQILHVYRESRDDYTVSGWPVLIARAQRRLLLPKLRALHILGGEYAWRTGPDPKHEIMWITAFATSSTVEMHTSPNARWIQFPDTSLFLEALVNRCPNIERLTLCSNDYSPYAPIPSRLWYEHLDFLQNLRYMFVSTGWFYPPCILALGQLPQLESLEIGVGGFNEPKATDDYTFPLNLPPSAFPMLTRLSLKRIDPFEGEKILEIRGMLQKISYLYLDLNIKHVDSYEWDDSWVTEVLLPLLADISLLKHLEIKCVLDYHEGAAVISTGLHVLSQLPLEIVQLGAFHLGDGILGLDLGTIWPNVTKLSMPALEVSLLELSHLVSMPRLEYLNVQFCLSIKHGLEGIQASRSPGKFTLALGWLDTLAIGWEDRLGKQFHVVDHNARVLASLWPNLRLDTSLTPGRLGDRSWRRERKDFNALLNLHARLEIAEREQDLDKVTKIRSKHNVLRRKMEKNMAGRQK